jgi:ArsR family transcriptional regulator, arsenate/arsenite/antimonite-responsive transcriptional repressor
MDSKTVATESAKPGRLTRARRTAILKALADPKRFELLERIAAASCPLSCSAVRPALAISPATLSHHMKELETAGLIQITREGKFHFLSLRSGVLDSLIAVLGKLRSAGCAAPPAGRE